MRAMPATQLAFDLTDTLISKPKTAQAKDMRMELAAFREFGTETLVDSLNLPGAASIPVYVNEFWTAKQRAAHSLHEVSYRACFKPQLPHFFIKRLTQEGETVYDPFMGRGTTPLEAAMMGRVPYACDINPLSRILLEPRLEPPSLQQVEKRLSQIDLTRDCEAPDDLLVFYHPETLRAIACLRVHFQEQESAGSLDTVDAWIRMVATNRLTGHSPGFFSVYSMPPNQAVSVASQRKINEKRQQTPTARDVGAIIRKKTKQLLGDYDGGLSGVLAKAKLLTRSCDHTPEIPSNSVSLVVTSPPFLAAVQYEIDNWLRCWFNHIDPKQVGIWQFPKVPRWQEAMTSALVELERVLRPGGHVAFEVGELQHGKLRLEEIVVPAGIKAGLKPLLILINSQEFTKTSNCWGIDNKTKGTNSNRIVLFQKSA